jgi:hypothetical protein
MIPMMVLGLTTGATFAFSGGGAGATVTESDGNVTTCSQVGFPDSTQIAGDGDENVGIEANDTSIEVDVLNPDVVIDAIVVKGGPNANVFTNVGSGTYSTPTNPNNDEPYGLSHYFVCYHLEEGTTTTTSTTTTTTTQPTVTTAAAPTPTATPQTVVVTPRVVTVQPRFTG